MGLILSSGFFKFIPPTPGITSLSSISGEINQNISIYGNDLDYVDNLYVSNQNASFNLINPTQINFVVPDNPGTGYVSIYSEGIDIQQNNLNFTPIFSITNFEPKNGSAGSEIFIEGKVLDSIITGYVYANPLFDDIEYNFLKTEKSIIIPTTQNTGQSEIILLQNFNLFPEENGFSVTNIFHPDIISGRAIEITYKSKTGIGQQYYQVHLFTFPIIDTDNIKSNKIRLDTSTGITFPILFNSNFEDTGYAVFFQINFTGTGIGKEWGYNVPNAYTELKTSSGFHLSFCDNFTFDIDVNYIAFKYGTGVYDSGIYYCSRKDIPSGFLTYPVEFPNNNLYEPFILTAFTCPTTGDITPEAEETLAGKTFLNANIYNLTNNQFFVNYPSGLSEFSGTGVMNVDYILFNNPNANLNTFVYEGTGSSYKKLFLFSGDESSFQKAIPLDDIQIIDKNNLSFIMPFTDFHINGQILLKNNLNIEKKSQLKILETPIINFINPGIGYQGDTVLISGDSFKKIILNDGPSGYNSVLVKFIYSGTRLSQKNYNFDVNCTLLNVNTLSGRLPAGNKPSGIYILQISDEQGNIYE